MPEPTAKPLTVRTPLEEILPKSIPDDAMVHLTPLEAVPGEGLSTGHWVQWGEVKTLDLAQYKVGVVGVNAQGSLPSANTMFVVRQAPEGLFQYRGIANMQGAKEYYPTRPVTAAEAEAFVITENP